MTLLGLSNAIMNRGKKGVRGRFKKTVYLSKRDSIVNPKKIARKGPYVCEPFACVGARRERGGKLLQT